jgi:hypothetical protein
MKKFTTVFILVAFAVVAFAQNRVAIQAEKLGQMPISKAVDTLMPMSFLTGSPTYYITVETGTTDTGYVAGTNWYGDLAKAQGFLYDSPYNLTGCLVWVADGAGSVGNVTFNVYAADGPGEAVSGVIAYAPGTILGSTTVAFSSMIWGLDWATGINYFPLTTPIFINADYYVGLDFSAMGAFPANKFGIVSTTDGDAGGTELSWEKWAGTDGWFSMLAAWPLDFDFAFFPIIDDAASIEEAYINNVMLSIYPNPVADEATIQYNLKNSANNVNIMVLDITGKAVASFELGAQTAGAHTVSFDASQFAPGTYLYAIQADGNRLGKKFIVE